MITWTPIFPFYGVRRVFLPFCHNLSPVEVYPRDIVIVIRLILMVTWLAGFVEYFGFL